MLREAKGPAQALRKWCSCLHTFLRDGTNLISEMHVLGAWSSYWRWEWFVVLKFGFSLPVVLLQGDSLARCPKILSIKNYVIEIMT